MRVLVACEFSGAVRDAFTARGHDAWSCDLLPSETPGEHFTGDVHTFLHKHGTPLFDLIIAHPPCTYLANSGVRWLYGGRGAVRDPQRWRKMEEAASIFRWFLHLNPTRICVENPIMHRYGREIIGRKHDQLIQPHQFGHNETKATCFWLKGLKPLIPTHRVPANVNLEPRVHYASPGPDRWKERSRTLPGIAAAMAEQWGQTNDHQG